MPGVDFNRLRSEITMSEVLDQLGFQATSRTGTSSRGHVRSTVRAARVVERFR